MSPVSRFHWPVRVYYEDTDCGGVVYYANYLKFMERARTEWLRSLGFEQDTLVKELRIIFAVTEAHLRYRLPARFNDSLTVVTELARMQRASMSFHQTVQREPDQALLCTGEIRIAALDINTMRATAIPQAIYQRIAL